MTSLLERKLLVVTGKGGVGKTTVAAALGLAAAQRGLHAIVVEVGDQRRLPGLFGLSGNDVGSETKLEERMSSISIDPDHALLEWLQALGGRILAAYSPPAAPSNTSQQPLPAPRSW